MSDSICRPDPTIDPVNFEAAETACRLLDQFEEAWIGLLDNYPNYNYDDIRATLSVLSELE